MSSGTMNGNYKTITPRDLERMHYTQMIAKLSACRYRLGAVIYRGRKPISVGVNVIKTHTDHQHYGQHVISIHAEHAAILKAATSVDGCTLYVARDGGTTSMPCVSCRAYMIEAGVSVVVYMLRGDIIKEVL